MSETLTHTRSVIFIFVSCNGGGQVFIDIPVDNIKGVRSFLVTTEHPFFDYCNYLQQIKIIELSNAIADKFPPS